MNGGGGGGGRLSLHKETKKDVTIQNWFSQKNCQKMPRIFYYFEIILGKFPSNIYDFALIDLSIFCNIIMYFIDTGWLNNVGPLFNTKMFNKSTMYNGIKSSMSHTIWCHFYTPNNLTPHKIDIFGNSLNKIRRRENFYKNWTQTNNISFLQNICL